MPELKIEEELRDLLFTTTDCSPLFMPMIHRKFRRDYYDNRINCPACNSTASGELEGQIGCPYCSGLGWLWDDVIIEGWLYNFQPRKAANSLTYPSPVGQDLDRDHQIVTKPECYIHPGDLIFDVKIDENKRIQIPLVIQEKYLCTYSDRMTSNGSNSEYNIAGLRK